MPVPLPANLSDFIVDRQAAIVLGKAFFWDQQAGSDGIACGSCHFHAGADNRVKNAIDPGLRNENPALQNIFHVTASNKGLKVGPPPGGGPNYTLKKADYPFHQLADPTDRNSAVLFDSNDITGSAGVFRADYLFMNVLPNSNPRKIEVCSQALSPTFSVNGINTRQVEPRNTPTVINAIYNFRSFWDSRANNVFNGRNPFGMRDPTAGIDPMNSVLVADAAGNLTPLPVSLSDASAASQAVGPTTSNLEMSCSGRVFEQIGQKVLRLTPLMGQTVDSTDSVLGPYANKVGVAANGAFMPATGLTIGYQALIQKAFPAKFWSSNQRSPDGFRQIEKNFSLFWGLAIMMYESTLVSDDTPFDRYISGNISALTTQQATGFQTFLGNGGCIFCHRGPEFTGAASTLKDLRNLGANIEHMNMGDGQVALYDSGSYNIGVRPPGDDRGLGSTDPFGNPLSFSRQATDAVAAGLADVSMLGIGPDLINVFTCNFEIAPCFPVTSNARDAIDGSFKVPSLRNVELTGPYFHNGGQATLEQVIDFYNRGGDAAGTDPLNTTGFAANPTNRAPSIFPLKLNPTEKANLVAFLKALTDDRVRWEKAPFDHPSINVPNGHPVSELSVPRNGTSPFAVDTFMLIPAVGAAGRAAKGLGPLMPFDAGLQ